MNDETHVAHFFPARPETEDVATALGEALSAYFFDAESQEQRILLMKI